MPLVTVGDIKTAVRAHGFETDTAGQQLAFINEEQRELLAERRWRFMLRSATVAAVIGTGSYALPASPAVMDLESIRFGVAGDIAPELEWMDPEELLESAAAYGSIAYAGESPTGWSETLPGYFQVWPAPQRAGTFTVRYFTPAADLTADVDVPDVPQPYRDILVLGCAMRLAGREGKLDRVAYFETRRDNRIAAMFKRYGIPQRQTSSQVGTSGDKTYSNDLTWRGL